MKRDELTKHNDTMRVWYFADEADAVMDALESEKGNLEAIVDELESEIKGMEERIKAKNSRIKELETSKPKWISVKDRLPDECETVLVYYAKYKEYKVEWIEPFENKLCSGELNYPALRFTHWMPLPLPPKADK